MDKTHLFLFLAGALGGLAHGLLPFIEPNTEGALADLFDPRAWLRALVWALVGGVAGITTDILAVEKPSLAIAVLAGFGGPLLLSSGAQRVAEAMRAVQLRSALSEADAHLAEAESDLSSAAGIESFADGSGKHPSLARIQRARAALARTPKPTKPKG
ncbi:MAG: hypothetical protein ABIO70_08775 [Pseudomonadota bacterium]